MYWIRLLRRSKWLMHTKCLARSSCLRWALRSYYLLFLFPYLSSTYLDFFFSQLPLTNSIVFIVLGFLIFPPYSSPTPKHLFLKFDFRLLFFSDTIIITWKVPDNKNLIYLKYKIFSIEWWQGLTILITIPRLNLILITTIFLTLSLGF